LDKKIILQKIFVGWFIISFPLVGIGLVLSIIGTYNEPIYTINFSEDILFHEQGIGIIIATLGVIGFFIFFFIMWINPYHNPSKPHEL